MKTVVFVHQHFRLPEEGGGIRSYFLAKKLADLGINIQVLAGRSMSEVKSLEISSYFKVNYLDVNYSQSYSFFQRINSFYQFTKAAKGFLKKENLNPDLAYVISVPLSVGLVALNWKKKRSIPYVFEVGDLWPDVPVKMGILRNRILKHLAYSLEKRSYDNASLISSLSPAISDSIIKKTNTEVISIPNFSLRALFSPSDLGKRAEEGTFHIGYLGSFGRANGISFLKNLVLESQNSKPKTHFHFMGSGSELNTFKNEVEKFKNVTFYSQGGLIDVKQTMTKIDLGIVSFSDFEILGTGSPNKLFDYLAAGKIIICNSKGWFQKEIEDSEAGVYIPYKNPNSLFNFLGTLEKKPREFERIQLNALELSKKFDVDFLLNQWADKILSLEALQD